MINREKATTGQVSGGRPDLHCASRIYGAGHLIGAALSLSHAYGTVVAAGDVGMDSGAAELREQVRHGLALGEDFCRYYAAHRNKTVVYYFDATALGSN